MVRTLARARELAVRYRAGRPQGGRFVRQFVTEGLRAVGDRRAGCRCRWPGRDCRLIARFRPKRCSAAQIDEHELSFVAIVALICPLVFSIAPVRLMSRPDMRQVLAGSGGAASTAHIARPRRAGRAAGGAGRDPAHGVEPGVEKRSRHLRAADRHRHRRSHRDGPRIQRRACTRRRHAAAAAEETTSRLAALPGVRNGWRGERAAGSRRPHARAAGPRHGGWRAVNEVKPNAVVTGATSGAGAALGAAHAGRRVVARRQIAMWR